MVDSIKKVNGVAGSKPSAGASSPGSENKVNSVWESKIDTTKYWNDKNNAEDVKIPYRRHEKEEPVKNASDEAAIEQPQQEPKTTKYVVQLGENIEVLVRKSLKAQGVENPDEKQLAEATAKFKESNAEIIKINKKGVEYLIAGKEAILEGEVDTTGNKNAKEVNDEWAKNHASRTKSASVASENVENEPEVKPEANASPSTGKSSTQQPATTNHPPAVNRPNTQPPSVNSAPPAENKKAEKQPEANKTQESKNENKPAPPVGVKTVPAGKISTKELKHAGVDVKPDATFKRLKDGSLVQEYKEGNVVRRETYDKNKKLVQKENQYNNGHTMTEFYSNGKVVKRVLKEGDRETTFDNYVNGKAKSLTRVENGQTFEFDTKLKKWLKRSNEVANKTAPEDLNQAMRNRAAAILKASQRLGTDEQTFLRNVTRDLIEVGGKDGNIKWFNLTKEEYIALDKHIRALNTSTPNGYHKNGLKDWIRSEFNLEDQSKLENRIMLQVYKDIQSKGL